MSDEEIIKKRLLIDGDGTGEDRRLNVVLKHFLKWASSKNDLPEANQISFDRLLAQLAQSQFAAAKTQYISKMITEELKNYGKLSEHIEKSIEMANQQIEDSKEELLLAKQIRKNKMEYDMFAKLIKEQPDRKETTKEIDTLKKDMTQLNEKKAKLERKFQKRRKDFTLLMYCVRELEKQLKDDEACIMSEHSDVEDEPVTRVHVSTAAATNGDTSSSGVVGAMDLSDDEQPLEDSSRTRKRRRRDKDYSKEATVGEEEENKCPLSVEEDTVLELSIDKDENYVVKLEESLAAA